MKVFILFMVFVGHAMSAVMLSKIEEDAVFKVTLLEDAISYHLAGEYKRSVSEFRKYSEQGLARAQYLLAPCYLRGEGVKVSIREAEKYLAMAAVTLPAAQRELALVYLQGGDQRKKGQAIELLHQAHDQEDREASYALGYFYALGMYLNRNPEKAMAFLKRAHEKGHPEAVVAMISLLPLNITSEHRGELLPQLQKRVRQNHAAAHTSMGYCFALGVFGLPQDPGMAFQQFLKGVKGGHATAFHEVARCYEKGFGIAKD